MKDLPPAVFRSVRELPFEALAVRLGPGALRFLRAAPSVPARRWTAEMERARRVLLRELDLIERRVRLEVEIRSAARPDGRVDVDAVNAAVLAWARGEQEGEDAAAP